MSHNDTKPGFVNAIKKLMLSQHLRFRDDLLLSNPRERAGGYNPTPIQQTKWKKIAFKKFIYHKMKIAKEGLWNNKKWLNEKTELKGLLLQFEGRRYEEEYLKSMAKAFVNWGEEDQFIVPEPPQITLLRKQQHTSGGGS